MLAAIATVGFGPFGSPGASSWSTLHALRRAGPPGPRTWITASAATDTDEFDVRARPLLVLPLRTQPLPTRTTACRCMLTSRSPHERISQQLLTLQRPRPAALYHSPSTR
eukprot:scaffold28841_cov101-Isochrysis_galbana.AAC.2